MSGILSETLTRASVQAKVRPRELYFRAPAHNKPFLRVCAIAVVYLDGRPIGELRASDVNALCSVQGVNFDAAVWWEDTSGAKSTMPV